MAKPTYGMLRTDASLKLKNEPICENISTGYTFNSSIPGTLKLIKASTNVKAIPDQKVCLPRGKIIFLKTIQRL